MTPTFVVSTGRSGSTLVSNMVRLHPDVLSLSDLFVNLLPGAFPPGPLTGDGFWDVLGRPRRRETLMLRLGIADDEILYRPGPGARFTAETGVPPVLLTTLPHLTDAPEALLDAIEEWTRALDARPAGVQYARLFAWLAGRFGRRAVIERSGSSLDWIEDLIAGFPGARFVHLHRDGRDCAISMSRHSTFKLGVVGQRLRWRLGVDPFTSDEPPSAAPPAALRPFMPETFDRERYRRLEVPFEELGRTWSRMVLRGAEHLARLPGDRVLPIRYETLLAEPAEELRRLARFVGVAEDERWLRDAAALVRPTPHRWVTLPEDARRRLEDACAPGMRLLYGES